jgi:hypothetical protein
VCLVTSCFNFIRGTLYHKFIFVLLHVFNFHVQRWICNVASYYFTEINKLTLKINQITNQIEHHCDATTVMAVCLSMDKQVIVVLS